MEAQPKVMITGFGGAMVKRRIERNLLSKLIRLSNLLLLIC